MANEIPIPLGELTDHETMILMVQMTNANTKNIDKLTTIVSGHHERLTQIDTRCEERHSSNSVSGKPIPAKVEALNSRIYMVIAAMSTGAVIGVGIIAGLITKIAGWW